MTTSSVSARLADNDGPVLRLEAALDMVIAVAALERAPSSESTGSPRESPIRPCSVRRPETEGGWRRGGTHRPRRLGTPATSPNDPGSAPD